MLVNEIWGHVIYKPLRRARWKVPRGMKTLREFLAWHTLQGLDQRRGDHPIALEVYVKFSTRKIVRGDVLRTIVLYLVDEILVKGLMFSRDLLSKYMEWGIERKRRILPEPIYAEVRWSRDGIEFQVKNITSAVEYMLRQIDHEYKLGVYFGE